MESDRSDASVLSSESNSRSSTSYEADESPNADAILRHQQKVEDAMNQEQVLVVRGGRAVLTSPDESILLLTPSPNTARVYLSPFSVQFFPWMPLTSADAQILSDCSTSLLRGTDSKLSALHLIHSVLLKDFSPDILLQRPRTLKALFNCLQCKEERVLLLTSQCLLQFSKCLHLRLRTQLEPNDSYCAATLLHSKETCPSGCAERYTSFDHQTLESEAAYRFEGAVSDPVDDMIREDIKEQYSVQEFVMLVLESPLPSQAFFGSCWASLRSAAAELMAELLSIIKLSTNFEVVWNTGTDPESNDINFEIATVQHFVAALKTGMDALAQCLLRSYEECWLCEEEPQLQQQCSIFVQCKTALMAWLHCMVLPAQRCPQILSENTAEAIVLILCDVTSILRLLSRTSPNVKKRFVFDVSSLLASFAQLTTNSLPSKPEQASSTSCLLLNDDCKNDCPEDDIHEKSESQFKDCDVTSIPEHFVTLFLLLDQVDHIASTQVFVEKLVMGLCKRYKAAEDNLRLAVVVLLTRLVLLPDHMSSAAVLGVVHKLLAQSLGAVAATRSSVAQQRLLDLCEAFTQRPVLASLLHSTAHHLPSIAQLSVKSIQLLLSSEHTLGPQNWQRLCISSLALLPDFWLLTDSNDLCRLLGALPDAVQRSLSPDDAVDLQLTTLSLYHKDSNIRRKALPLVAQFLNSVAAEQRLLSVLEQHDSGDEDLLLVEAMALRPDHRHVELQPDQVIRLMELLDHSHLTSATNTTAVGSMNMVGAVWRQLAYLCQHPGHHSTLLALVTPSYFVAALREMLQESGCERGFSLSDASSCIEVLRLLAVHHTKCRQLMATSHELFHLVIRAVLLRRDELHLRRQASMLLSVLLFHPFIFFSDKEQDLERSQHPEQGPTRQSSEQLIVDSLPISPKLPKLVVDTLRLPFFCATDKSVSQEALHGCRTFLHGLVPAHFLQFSSTEVEIGVDHQLNEGLSHAAKVLELLRQSGGCSEQIYALLKMVWAVSAAGGVDEVSNLVDYSANFSEFFRMSNREKLLFNCLSGCNSIKNLLTNIENITTVKYVKRYLTLLESTILSHKLYHRDLCLTTYSTKCLVCSSEDFKAFLSDRWWTALRRFITKEPNTAAEQQIFAHAVLILSCVCQSLLELARCHQHSTEETSIVRELHALLQLPYSPLCSTLRSAGTHNFKLESNCSEDEMKYTLLTSICSLLIHMASLSLPSSNTPDMVSCDGPKSQIIGTSTALAVIEALEPVLHTEFQQNAFSIGVLYSAASCLCRMCNVGWIQSEKEVSLLLSNAINLLNSLSAGRGHITNILLGRGATLSVCSMLCACIQHSATVVTHLEFVSDKQLSKDEALEQTTSLDWVASLLSYRDVGVRVQVWQTLLLVTETPAGVKWLSDYVHGTELYAALFLCIKNSSSPASERTAALCVAAHVAVYTQACAANRETAPAAQGYQESLFSISDALLVDKEFGVVMANILDCTGRQHSDTSALPHWPEAAPMTLGAAACLLLTDLLCLNQASAMHLIQSAALLPLAVLQLVRCCMVISSKATAAAEAVGVCVELRELEEACVALESSASFVVAVIRARPSMVVAIARDSALPRALVSTLSIRGVWLGDSAVASCFELLASLVDSRVLKEELLCDQPTSGREKVQRIHGSDQDEAVPDQLWGCVRVMEALHTHPNQFIGTLVSSLHSTIPPQLKSLRKQVNISCFDSKFCTACDTELNYSKRLRRNLNQSASVFLSVFIHALIDHCDQVPDSSLPSLEHLFNILATPTCLLSLALVCPGYELARHLIQLISSEFSLQKRAESGVLSTLTQQVAFRKDKLSSVKGPKKTIAKYSRNGYIKCGKPGIIQASTSDSCVNCDMCHKTRRLNKDSCSSYSCVYIECLGMLAFVNRAARYACYHLSNQLWPLLLQHLNDLPNLIADRGVHFTANLFGKKEVSGTVKDVCRNLRLLTNIVCERGDSNDYVIPDEVFQEEGREEGAQKLAEAVLPLLHSLWLPSLHTPELLYHVLSFIVTATQHTHVCGLLLRTTTVPPSLLSSQPSSRPLLSCLTHVAIQNISAMLKDFSVAGYRMTDRQNKCKQQRDSPLSSPRFLISPSYLRGSNVTLLGGGAALADQSTYLILCALANCARHPECAALIVKSGLIPHLLECAASSAKRKKNSQLDCIAGASVRLLTVLSLHSICHGVIVRYPGWLSRLYESLVTPAASDGDELCIHTLRLLTSITSFPSAVQAMISTEEFIGRVVEVFSKRVLESTSSQLRESMNSSDGLCRALVVLFWALAVRGHRAQSVLRQLALHPLLNHIDELLQGQCDVVSTLLQILKT